MEYKILTKSFSDTIEYGRKLGLLLKPNSLICMRGDLACGKTTFTKGIGMGIGVTTVINSPTFTILKIYHGQMPLFHIDAYRLLDNDYDLGFEELLSDDGVVVVEWCDYMSNMLGDEYLELEFEHIDENTRSIKMLAHGKKYEQLLEEYYASAMC